MTDPESALRRRVLASLLTLAAVAGVAPELAPLSPQAQLDPAVGARLPPASRRWVVARTDRRVWLAESVHPTSRGWSIVRGGRVARLDREMLSAEPRRLLFVLGTDRLGRDILSRLLHAARASVAVGMAAAAFALAAGLAVGGLAALYGGAADLLLMRLADSLSAIPRTFFLLALAAAFQPGLVGLTLILGLTSWAGTARLARARLLVAREADYVTAARGLGLRPPRVLLRHLLPSVWTPLSVDAALRVGDAILVEASLSFLGAGIQPPTPSWGNMIADAVDGGLHEPWGWLFPGLAVTVTVLATTWLADHIRDARAGRP